MFSKAPKRYKSIKSVKISTLIFFRGYKNLISDRKLFATGHAATNLAHSTADTQIFQTFHTATDNQKMFEHFNTFKTEDLFRYLTSALSNKISSNYSI